MRRRPRWSAGSRRRTARPRPRGTGRRARQSHASRSSTSNATVSMTRPSSLISVITEHFESPTRSLLRLPTDDAALECEAIAPRREQRDLGIRGLPHDRLGRRLGAFALEANTRAPVVHVVVGARTSPRGRLRRGGTSRRAGAGHSRSTVRRDRAPTIRRELGEPGPGRGERVFGEVLEARDDAVLHDRDADHHASIDPRRLWSPCCERAPRCRGSPGRRRPSSFAGRARARSWPGCRRKSRRDLRTFQNAPCGGRRSRASVSRARAARPSRVG